MAAETDYPKLNGFKQLKFIPLQFWRPEPEITFVGLKSGVGRAVRQLEAPGLFQLLELLALWPQNSSPCPHGHTAVSSVSDLLCLLLIEVLVITVRAPRESRVLTPPQTVLDSPLCTVSFVTKGSGALGGVSLGILVTLPGLRGQQGHLLDSAGRSQGPERTYRLFIFLG